MISVFGEMLSATRQTGRLQVVCSGVAVEHVEHVDRTALVLSIDVCRSAVSGDTDVERLQDRGRRRRRRRAARAELAAAPRGHQARLEGTKLIYACSGVVDAGTAAAFGRPENSLRFRFADADTNSKTAYCRNGQWIPPLVPCIGAQT